MVWTEEMIFQLRTLWAEGHSTREIGRRMKLSKNAIVGKAHRIDLVGRPTPIKPGGAKVVAIARAGASTLPELPSLRPPSKYKAVVTPELILRMRELVAEGKTLVEVGAEVGLSDTTVSKYCPRDMRPVVLRPRVVAEKPPKPRVFQAAGVGVLSSTAVRFLEARDDRVWEPVSMPPMPRRVQPVSFSKPRQCLFLIGDEKPWMQCSHDRWERSRTYCRSHHLLCHSVRGEVAA